MFNCALKDGIAIHAFVRPRHGKRRRKLTDLVVMAEAGLMVLMVVVKVLLWIPMAVVQ